MDGVRINYKIGGRGPVVVLLHGYTQTSHMWIPLMPLLAASHTVIAPDLRGAGNSERAKDGYDKKTLAKDIRTLVRQLGYEQVQLVGHDIGLMVAYAYAAQYPKEVGKVVLMDAFLPGIGNWKDVWLLRDLWHFHFYGDVPLALVKGRERIYFEHFWNDFAADKTKSVPEADRRIYAAAYARETACAQASSTSRLSSRTRRTSQRSRRPSWTCPSSCLRVRKPRAPSSSTRRNWSRPTCPAP